MYKVKVEGDHPHIESGEVVEFENEEEFIHWLGTEIPNDMVWKDISEYDRKILVHKWDKPRKDN